jgi:hypothetical protein
LERGAMDHFIAVPLILIAPLQAWTKRFIASVFFVVHREELVDGGRTT